MVSTKDERKWRGRTGDDDAQVTEIVDVTLQLPGQVKIWIRRKKKWRRCTQLCSIDYAGQACWPVSMILQDGRNLEDW